MSKVTRLPRMFRRAELPPAVTTDRRIGAVIIIQESLSGLSDEECEFVIRTVQTNLDLSRRYSAAYEFED